MKPGAFKEEYIAIILRELLKGLEHLHNENKLHRGRFILYLCINITAFDAYVLTVIYSYHRQP